MNEIDRIIKQSDKAELVEWVNNNIVKADKCIVAFATKEDGKMILDGKQIGFDWVFEIEGFVKWALESFMDESYNEDEE